MSSREQMAAVIGIAASACCVGCGSSHSATSARTASASTASKPTVTAPPPRPHGPPPGTLPQTHQLPSSHTAAFKAEMNDLWEAVRTGTTKPAVAAFFPERAYAQVKAIADPAGDFKSRLLGAYRLDIASAHALLGAGARNAKLIGVQVPGSYVHWVDPGACLNRIGYYEVPNSRIVYRENGQVRSFGIASMISWRGVWYVVHLGSVTGGPGTVDDPSSGPGSPAASSTC